MTTPHSQYQQAIAYLLTHTPPETLHHVHTLTTNPEGTGWPAMHHFGLGIWVRNKLRERFTWDDVTLDNLWAELIETAAQRAQTNCPATPGHPGKLPSSDEG